MTALDQKTEPQGISSRITPRLLSQTYGSFLGLAVGDALGATLEFMEPHEIQKQYGVHRNIVGGGWLRLKKGDVTDDTSMTFALAESILNAGRVDAFAMAQGLSDWMVKKPVDIGNTVRKGIVHYRLSGIPCSPVSEHDAGNGACMRSLAIVMATLFASEKDAISASRLQSHITHNNTLSDVGTECIMRMLRAIFAGTDKQHIYQKFIPEFLQTHPEYEFRNTEINSPSGYIVETLQAVFQSFFFHDSFEEILVDVVNRGGDADTTGAIAGMLAGAYYSLENIPRKWLKSLRPDVVDTCYSLTDKLLKFSRSSYYT